MGSTFYDLSSLRKALEAGAQSNADFALTGKRTEENPDPLATALHKHHVKHEGVKTNTDAPQHNRQFIREFGSRAPSQVPISSSMDWV